jgi:hypothetical protein
MPPYEIDNVVGRPLLVDLAEEDALAFEHVGPAGAPVQSGADGSRG